MATRVYHLARSWSDKPSSSFFRSFESSNYRFIPFVMSQIEGAPMHWQHYAPIDVRMSLEGFLGRHMNIFPHLTGAIGTDLNDSQIKWPEFFGELTKAGFDGNVIIELEDPNYFGGREQAIAGTKRSIQYLDSLGIRG